MVAFIGSSSFASMACLASFLSILSQRTFKLPPKLPNVPHSPLFTFMADKSLNGFGSPCDQLKKSIFLPSGQQKAPPHSGSLSAASQMALDILPCKRSIMNVCSAWLSMIGKVPPLSLQSCFALE